jgi:hypothetical protein
LRVIVGFTTNRRNEQQLRNTSEIKKQKLEKERKRMVLRSVLKKKKTIGARLFLDYQNSFQFSLCVANVNNMPPSATSVLNNSSN